MDEFDFKMTDSEDDEGAGERVRMVMEEIYKNQDNIKCEKDIEEMAERCTNMMTQMRNEAYLKKKDKRTTKGAGSGDKATPPPSRASVKESPRKDSTRTSASPRVPAATKINLKDQIDGKKKQRPNFAEMYKEKMDKMRVQSKSDPRGSQNKTDSTKPSKAKVGMGDSRRKMDKMVEDLSTETESESESGTTESESAGSDEQLQNVLEASRNYDKLMKDMKSRETFRGSTKEIDAHKKATEWMSATRGEQVKKKEVAASSTSKTANKTNPNLSFYSSSDMDSEDEKIAQQLKSKMTMSSKKQLPESKDALRKLMASMSEKPSKATAAAKTQMSMKKPPAPSATKVAGTRPGPASEKTKPKKKM